jgi:hypothetical protein
VTSISYVASDPNALPSMVVSNAHGTAVVPGNFPQRHSPDGRMHVCINGRVSPPKLICIFMPDGQ